MFLGKTLYSHSASLHPGVKMGTGEFNSRSNPFQPGVGGLEILLVASCYGNHHKLWPDGPFGSFTDLTF